jgi:hypothetical protein
MFYIHQSICISPQETYSKVDLSALNEPAENKLMVVEPDYTGIPPSSLRRMGKAVRIGIGAALPLINQGSAEGIVLGTANGGMEDCIKFLDQMVTYKEALLTPGNFVQGTPNSIAGQLGMITGNKGYNITHVHRGLAFENAMIDTGMLLKENPDASYLLGGVDEISAFDHNIDTLAGWFKKEPVGSTTFYNLDTPGSIAGEGASMFLVNNDAGEALARVEDLLTFHTSNEATVRNNIAAFLSRNSYTAGKIDLLLTGENGDNRLLHYYHACEQLLGADATIARFKHMSGEYATASAFALWISCQVLSRQRLPEHMIKKNSGSKNYNRILIYNNFKHVQHSLMLVSRV